MKLATSSLTIFLALWSYPGVIGREVLVDDPGVDNIVHSMQMIPNILGYPEGKDPVLKISSNVPVSILRYNDNNYLEGQEPVTKQDLYVVVKSNCLSEESIDVQVDLTEYNRTLYNGWDTSNYTDSITIDVFATDATTSLVVDDGFLSASSFLAYWNYTSFFCAGPPSEAEADTPPPTPATATDLQTTQEDGKDGTVGAPAVTEDVLALATSSPSPSLTESSSATRFASGMLATLFAGIVGAVLLVRDSTSRTGRNHGGIKALAVIAIAIGALVVHFQTMNSDDNIVSHSSHKRTRRLEETCSASVEIIIDGCRRASLENKIDIEVQAPDVRILDVNYTEVSRMPSPDDACTYDFVGYLDFNTTETPLADRGVVVPAERAQLAPTPIFYIPSMTDDWENGIQCMRPVEGRPFVDADGNQLQASANIMMMTMMKERNNHQVAAWSAKKDSYNVISKEDDTTDITVDQVLGREWTERALGEHASVPAFAAFTLALMSNNAPPNLVQDALTAAMDEVRHAQTSFEVASLLLGTTVEPGPIPPSTHTFSQNMAALAVAAAQEGCIDETLSALVAAYEVDTRIEQNPRINDYTKSLLKDKIRTIALEETRHSALAWRTVRWACEMEPEACSVVKTTVFNPENLSRGFEKRFGRYDLLDRNVAQTAWEQVYSQLIPFVVLDGSSTVAELMQSEECELSVQRALSDNILEGDGGSLLKEMAVQIIQNAICATQSK